MNTAARLEALRARLADEDIEAFLSSKVTNMRYLTGFEGVIDDAMEAAAVVSPDGAWFHTDGRYAEAAEGAARGTEWRVVIHREGLFEGICDDLERLGLETLGMGSSVSYGRFRYVSERSTGHVRVLDRFVERLREVKEDAEIERIAAAADLTDRAFAWILERIEPGRSERDIALDLEMYMRREGSDGVAFTPIVASGPNSAKPHATVSDRVIGRGDPVKLDFGARVDEYCSDMTRTVCVGEADERMREVHAAVLAANEAATAEVRPGAEGKELDAVARQVLEARGLGDAFLHGLGHGVGLDVHEGPRLGRTSDDVLIEGAVVTIEPGAYIPGWGGVRIEDLLVVEPGGARLLSHSDRSLIEL